MISKKRIGKLIEKESGCYVINDGNIGYVHLKLKYEPELYVNGKDGYILYIYCNDRKEYKEEIFDEDLFETKEEAEWHKEFDCIEKPQYLKFPNWKQVESFMEYMRKFGLNYSDRVLSRIITSDSIYYFKLCKDLDLFTFELKQTYIGEDLCEQLTSRFPVGLGKATKENYTLACRKVKELFLGESDDDT